MRKQPSLAAITAALILFFAWAARGQDYVPGRFIVELETPSGKSGAAVAAVNKTALRAMVAERAGTVRDSLEHVINALVVDIAEERQAELAALPGVQRVYRDRRAIHAMDRAPQLVRAPEAWRLAGGEDQAGRGMKIAIVDSGIDKSHPAFQDDTLEPPDGFPKISRENDATGTNRKIVVARSYGISGTPDIRDLGGHGSAVASIAAGARHTSPVGEFSGIAPKAFLGLYRLDDNDGSFTSSGILRALEDVAQDGMDVLNLSIGFFPANRFEDDPVAQAIERMADKVIVAKSAGNFGPEPGFGTGPNAPSAITVGASMNDRTLGPAVEVPGIGGLAATRPDAELPAEPLVAPLIAAASPQDPEGLLCAAPAETDRFAGRIVLIQRGECTFEMKANHAQRGGAVGAILYTNANPVAALWTLGEAKLPMVMIANEHGVRVKAALDADPELAAKISFDLGAITVDADRMTNFSSRGPSASGGIHVDLVAPGENIFLAAQRSNAAGEIYSRTGYAVEGGTSFSSPMVAGAAAVLKAARPGLTVKQYKSLLVNTAAPFANAAGVLYGAQAAGAGRLDMERAMHATVAADPVAVNYGIGNRTADLTRELRFTNLSAEADTIAFTVQPLAGSAAPVISPATVTLGAGESRTVPVRLSGTAMAPGEHQGWVAVKSSRSEVDLHIPYWFGAS
ncbi:MAG: S8 family serine peptidase, partial [Bryobacterales bacterium]|nr:S8 family serine peptidase [Bryobacterales bacterium]